MAKMKTREEYVVAIMELRDMASEQGRVLTPGMVTEQALSNIPFGVGLLELLLEVGLDIRAHLQQRQALLESINECAIEQRDSLAGFFDIARQAESRLEFLYTEVAALSGAQPKSDDGEEIPLIQISNEERIAELLAKGELKGFEDEGEPSRDCPTCGAKGALKYNPDAGYYMCFKCQTIRGRVAGESSILCPVCRKENLVLDVAGEGVRHTCPGCGYYQDAKGGA